MKGFDVTVKDVSRAYGSFKALDDVSVEIRKGEFFSLLGPSGCGKTTLLRIIAGFDSPDVGTVLLDGKNILPLPPDKRQVNTVFQNYALFPHLSVFDNVAFPLRLKKIPVAKLQAKVREYLHLVQLDDHVDKKPSMLSGGQKQRVAIARALINEPSVLLLDEPLSALDAKLRQNLLVELDHLHDQIGITFIYVTHDQSEALSVSDRIAVMNQGKVLQIGTPYEIYESPATDFVARFIGETNLFPATVLSCAPFEEEYLVSLDIPDLGKSILVTDYDPLEVGQRVSFTIRPEKIKITGDEPRRVGKDINLFKGIVEEPIYSGFQSKYYVSLENQTVLKVIQQHNNYMDEGPDIDWKDQVYVSWSAEDGYIVEVIDT
ncbi:MAG: ABC transporter ATP-binding protein [Sphaerochaetaceae bacterium]|nr:ABC transporter ATP-binding protein [Sphaerochaetaceae bacterium]NLO59648.1 ABC transporter ATP-binding protein [Spirochaetales bacterium]MDD3670026.1 ABC transporter ATP-binding protein [Sphaerochaetaceae bacterium]MDD4260302.1 ABC transporter ATP-binding protein [Sphaerochaetaceae bacterium]MDD4762916.1 ABC transporter ATP-binding protein [Sphaerochaetaceae bacterium]